MTLNSARYILRETGHSMKRNPWLSIASVLTVMVSLVILGFSVFFLANTANIASSFESQLEIAVFMQNNVTAQQVQSLQGQIQATSGVASVTLVTKDQVLADFSKSLSGNQSNGTQSNLLGALGGTNPFPDKLTVKATNPQNVKTLADKLSAMPGVDRVRYGQDYVDKLLTFTKWLRWIGLAVVAAFAAASVVLISINVKMNVFSRRREIQIMKLVGASNAFIRWPFLLEGSALGLMGGGLAAVIVNTGYKWLSISIQTSLTFLPIVQNVALFHEIFAGLLFAGMAMGIIGSGLSLQKFLRV